MSKSEKTNPKGRWVRVFEYKGFDSEEEAQKFLEESMTKIEQLRAIIKDLMRGWDDAITDYFDRTSKALEELYDSLPGMLEWKPEKAEE
jgi:hypothetical protein